MQHDVTAPNETIILFTGHYLCCGNKRIVISRGTMRITNQAFNGAFLLHFLLLVFTKSKLQIGKQNNVFMSSLNTKFYY